ncbi:hypothetical protein ACIRD3_13585 [Kitasatospora sp. NPDC093550]|uniref:hypothetical protein n=1 Tax=Kitasatospora sp. NPDC093550 TaxID=3364089 RepID=UPI003826F6D7
MTWWPLDTLAGVVILALEAGATFLYGLHVGLRGWAGRDTEDENRVFVVVAVVVTATFGAGLRWAGLPVSGWIQFAVTGTILLLVLLQSVIGPWIAARRHRRPPPSKRRPKAGRGTGRNRREPYARPTGPSSWQAHRRATVPSIWVPAVLEAAEGPLFAELIVGAGAGLHEEIAAVAVRSGFVPTAGKATGAGEPPGTSGAVEVGGGGVERLVLDAGRREWEPDGPVGTTPGWLAAAEDRSVVLVTLVPPGTWPPDLAALEPASRREAFRRGLDRARAEGLALHGTAAVWRSSEGGAPAGGGR